MTPRYLTQVAARFHSKRALFALVSLGGVLLVMTIGHFVSEPLYVPFVGPLVFLPWMVFCACTWFHPEKGSLRMEEEGRVAVPVRNFVRWYAAFFLTSGIVASLVVWPVMAILWL